MRYVTFSPLKALQTFSRPPAGLNRCSLIHTLLPEFTMPLRPSRPASALLIAALVAVTTPTLAASDYAEEAEQAGRIADLDGRLRLERASGEAFELGDGQRLRPTTVREGDRLHTGWNSRLVIEVGPNRLKLDEKTDLLVRRLDPEGVNLELERGSLVLEVRRPENAWRWQVDTAAARHQPQGAGLFRIDAPDRRRGVETGSATAWRSALRIENEDGTLLLPPGQRAERDRYGRWQLGYPQADAFAAWAMNPSERDTSDDRHPRRWQAAPSWEVQTVPPPPRVIVMPAPIVIEPPPRHWRNEPDLRDPRPPRVVAPVQPQPPRPMPMPAPIPDPAPPRPDRRHHETAPVMPPAGPASSPSMPRQDEPRRSQRML